MSSPAKVFESQAINVSYEVHVKAPTATTFEALLEQLGPGAEDGKGQPMSMKIEAWPGGRWNRDLGDGNGHFWAHVQAIKKPTLLEFVGPLFMSFGVASNVQYRLSEENGGTLMKFHHLAVGLIPEDVRTGVQEGWRLISEKARKRAEAAAKKS
jgi:Activator of Hsp90 ATPase homolog 1-like protein